MSLQLSWALGGKMLAIRLAIPRGSTFVFKVAHPFMGLLWNLGQGSLKGLECIEPLQFVTEEPERSVFTPKEEKTSELLASVKEGLTYHQPELCEEGVNGTYFMKNKNGKIIAVFKPRDEEGGSNNNPKGFEDKEDFVNRGLVEGEGALREVAAYILDKGHFSGVPETEMATLNFLGEDGTVEKTGSLQRFVDNDGASWDYGPNKFPTREVHKIGILDLRLFNTDRHGGNILLRQKTNGEMELIPIDHGLSLPSTLNRAWFDWLMWPQAKQPFDEETQNYIHNIDVAADAQILKDMGTREECIRTMIISSSLLKKGAAAGLTLFDVANLMCREELENPSSLEKMYEKALENTQENPNEFMQVMDKIMDDEIVTLRSK